MTLLLTLGLLNDFVYRAKIILVSGIHWALCVHVSKGDDDRLQCVL